jgi:predicted MFS family arabinose efflux permease
MFAITLLFASVALVPLNGLGAAELEHRMRPGQRAEAFSWFIAATMMGGGIGSALSGTLAREIDPKIVPVVSACTFAACGVGLLVARAASARSKAAPPSRSPAPAPDDVELVFDEMSP